MSELGFVSRFKKRLQFVANKRGGLDVRISPYGYIAAYSSTLPERLYGLRKAESRDLALLLRKRKEGCPRAARLRMQPEKGLSDGFRNRCRSCGGEVNEVVVGFEAWF
jgi:hypothetical protein